MRIVVESALTHAERQREYRQRQGREGKDKDAVRKRVVRANAMPEFVGVDMEGIGRGSKHRAVLLGVGAEQYVARDMDRGLDWKEIFGFLYEQGRRRRQAAFVGFYLGYDYNQTLKSLPFNAAWLLLSKEGRAMRRITDKSRRFRRQNHPVRIGGWEMDMLGFKRLSIRPRPEGCVCYEAKPYVKCEHVYEPWMSVCDAGPFFQMSFLKVLDPEGWKDDPDGAVCSVEEYQRIKINKEKRAFFSRVDEEMCYYNALENELLARVMGRLAKGFAGVGIRLGKDQWYGPGASASKWLGKHGAVKRVQLIKKEGKNKRLMPEWFWDACKNSYFGGWFEIFSHGLIRRLSYNYDINNAYPYATTKLPHICGECRYERGNGEYAGNSEHVLLYATVFGKSTRIGPVPYRDKDGNILRPGVSKGWYWAHEIDAATRADLVKKVTTHEWVAFVGCDHDMPFTEVADLYQKRLDVGKNSAQGMAIKLNNNSLYGKFAQSVGGAPFNNWFYASYITSHCRTQILDAIATHPGKADSVLMVATDGIVFDAPHPVLPVSKKLGEWGKQELKMLTLFKPGVYWHKEGKENLVKVKSRGVPKDAFASSIDAVEEIFLYWHVDQCIAGKELSREFVRCGLDEAEFVTEQGWPHFAIPVKFRMKTCRQALIEGKWQSAAEVQEQTWLWQDSDPHLKRRRPVWNADKQRCDTYVRDLPVKEIQTWYHGEVRMEEEKDIGFGLDGVDALDSVVEMVQAIRDKPFMYDEASFEWERVH